jgi:hypothetical protein
VSNSSNEQYPNAEQMAYPVQVSNLGGALYPEKGLTKRELFAAMAMQGLIARGSSYSLQDAGVAVRYADALLAALENVNAKG